MTPNITFVQNNLNSILVYDATNTTQPLPGSINSMVLIIRSNVTPYKQYEFDLISYLKNNRITTEIFNITSEVLGLSDTELPDGVYYVDYYINNVYSKKSGFVLFNNVKAEVEKLLAETTYNTKLGNYDIEYVGDNSGYDIEKVRLAFTYLNDIQINAYKMNLVKAQDSLTKLEKLLGIIKKIK